MLIFIDDSGDAGFRLERGSSHYFVISLVIFDDNLEAEKMAVSIKELRRSLGMKDWEEFKFNKSNERIRIDFLKKISQFSFRVRAIVVNKEQIYSSELKSKKVSFYSYFIKETIKHSNDTIFDARIRLDGSGDREFKRQFLSYLRRELNSTKTIMRNFKMVDSKSDVLIQSADMIAGALRRSFEKKDHTYKDLIKNKIEDLWEFK